jgi:hypothetical protein
MTCSCKQGLLRRNPFTRPTHMGIASACSNGDALRCQRLITGIKQQINRRLLLLRTLVGAKSASGSCNPQGCRVSFQGQSRPGPKEQVARLKREVIRLLQQLLKIVGAKFVDISCSRTKCGEFVFNDRI